MRPTFFFPRSGVIYKNEKISLRVRSVCGGSRPGEWTLFFRSCRRSFVHSFVSSSFFFFRAYLVPFFHSLFSRASRFRALAFLRDGDSRDEGGVFCPRSFFSSFSNPPWLLLLRHIPVTPYSTVAAPRPSPSFAQFRRSTVSLTMNYDGRWPFSIAMPLRALSSMWWRRPPRQTAMPPT